MDVVVVDERGHHAWPLSKDTDVTVTVTRAAATSAHPLSAGPPTAGLAIAFIAAMMFTVTSQQSTIQEKKRRCCYNLLSRRL
jgi:hypothetical protein